MKGASTLILVIILGETITENKVELISVKTQDQLADIFTKPLEHGVFFVIRSQLGMVTSGLRENIDN